MLLRLREGDGETGNIEVNGSGSCRSFAFTTG